MGYRKCTDVAYTATLDIPNIIDFAIPAEKFGPNSL